MFEFPLIDEIDHNILMHKDVHFGGSFPLMIEYYEKEGKGTIDEFELDRLHELFQIEQENNLSLSSELLSQEAQEEIAEAKEKYTMLKKAYDLPEGHIARKIADLILSEDLEAQEEIKAVTESPESIPYLIDLIKDDKFYNPLFPGYGFAPLHAIQALGILKAASAITSLFEALSKTEFFGEEAVISSLFAIGEPAKEFLLGVLRKLPITKDNENAAIALLPFKEDPSVIASCLSLLFSLEARSKPTFFTYLLLLCEDLKEPKDQERLAELKHIPDLSSENKEELLWILKSFSSAKV